MEERIAGCEEWENVSHWGGFAEFLYDTRPASIKG
jgi:hypothetical protein